MPEHQPGKHSAKRRRAKATTRQPRTHDIQRPPATFGEQVTTTRRFCRSYATLPLALQQMLHKKVALLLENPRHPALHAHRFHHADDAVWECYVTFSYRLLYAFNAHTIDGCVLTLLEVGPHDILERPYSSSCPTNHHPTRPRRPP